MTRKEQLNTGAPWNKCAECGRFISYADFAEGKATNTLVTPESLTTHETFEVLCAAHSTTTPTPENTSVSAPSSVEESRTPITMESRKGTAPDTPEN